MAFKIKGPASKPTTPKPGGGSGLSLPKKLNEPPKELAQYIKCIFGEKGVGKTSLAAELEKNHIVCMYDPGRANLRIRQIPESGKPVLTWEDYKRYQSLIIQEGAVPVIDPIDGLYKACIESHCRKHNVKDLTELSDRGKGWRVAIDDFYDTLNKYRIAGIYPIYLSHVRARPLAIKGAVAFQKEGEEAPEIVQPTASAACWEYLRLATDMAWYMGYRGLERVLHVRGSEYVWAGGGVDDHFLQPKGYQGQGEQLNMIPLGKSPKQAVENIKRAWDNELPGYFYGVDTKVVPPGKKNKK